MTDEREPGKLPQDPIVAEVRQTREALSPQPVTTFMSSAAASLILLCQTDSPAEAPPGVSPA
jgi:hypothetical protein